MIPQSFSFVVINDLHYTSPECGTWLDGAMRQINAIAEVELALVLGDLAEAGTYAELAAAKKSLDLLRVPYYVVPGNHDGPANRPIGSGAGGLADYLKLFPGQRNYTFTHKGWQFLALDSSNGSGWKEVPLPEDTQAFVEHAAKTLDPKAPTILFTHFPLDPTVKFSMAGGNALLQSLKHLNLRIVFSGHFHGLTENLAPSQPHLKLLTNRGISRTREIHDPSKKRGFFLCHANTDETVDYNFVEYRG